MSFEIPGVLWRREPQTEEVPLVFDSPHSGSHYPDDFRFCCPLDVLRTAEDSYVDELYAAAPESGATLIGALFPRQLKGLLGGSGHGDPMTFARQGPLQGPADRFLVVNDQDVLQGVPRQC